MNNKNFTVKKIEIERSFADDVFKKYRHKRYGIGNCCGSDYDSNVNKKALCDFDENKKTTYLSTKITSETYTPPVGGAKDDPDRPAWVNELCGMDKGEVEIYFYYDATSLGIPQVQDAYAAAHAWVNLIRAENASIPQSDTSCRATGSQNITEYHTAVFGERWLDWGISSMTGAFNNTGNCASANSIFPPTVNTNSKFWGILKWAQTNNVLMYSGVGVGGETVASTATTDNSGGIFATTISNGIPPAASSKNLLAVTFIDEANTGSGNLGPYHGSKTSGPGTPCSWADATSNVGTANDGSDAVIQSCWKGDYTLFIQTRNIYLAQGTEFKANFFCYPSKPQIPVGGIAGPSHLAFPLHATGAISSGDKTTLDGTWTVAPFNTIVDLSRLEDGNPYFAQGFGALDQQGWGVEPSEQPFTAGGLQADLNAFTDLTSCNDSTCFTFKAVNQNGIPIPDYSVVLDGGNVGNTDEYGILRHCIGNGSIDTKHTLDLCHCFTTAGDCSSQNITITLTEECPDEICPAKPFIACEDPNVDPSGNTLSGCLDPLSPNFCPECTADCGGTVGGTDTSCCDYCADFTLSFISTDATDDTTDDGTIILTVSSGTPPYTFAWTGPNGFTATSQNLSSLAGGVYVVVVTDSSVPQCTATLTVFIEQPPNIVFGCMDVGTVCDEGMDVAFIVDMTSSMGGAIDDVKAGAAAIISQIATLVGTSDYKLSLTLFDEYNADPSKDDPALKPPYVSLPAYTSLPAAQRSVITQTTPSTFYPAGDFMKQYFTVMEMFGTNNGATFTTALNLLNTASFPLGNSNNHSGPEPSDIATDMVGLQNFSGTWRTGVARYVILMTDAISGNDNNSYVAGIDDVLLAAIAANLVAQDIKVIVVGTGANAQTPLATYPMRVFADATGGTWDAAAGGDYSTGTINALTTLCTGATPQACNYDALNTYDCAGVLGGTDFSCCLYSGCTDSAATNYDPTANADCNCETPGTMNPGWDSCCTGCKDGCMDPLANNYDPTATCADVCTYNWDCTGATATNTCDNLTDTGVYGDIGLQMGHTSNNFNVYQYTPIFTLQWENDIVPTTGDPCIGPNGGAMSYITSFGMNTPSNWGMNQSGYFTWAAFIADLQLLSTFIGTLNSTYGYVLDWMQNDGYDGTFYTMEVESDYCQCTNGAAATINSCVTSTSTNVTTGNPNDQSTIAGFMAIISVTYPTWQADNMFFCSSYNFTTVGAYGCGCGDTGSGPTGELFGRVISGYNDGQGGVVIGTSNQTWNGFVNALVAIAATGVTSGMDYAAVKGGPSGDFLNLAWNKCTCTQTQGCTCVEMINGQGKHADLAACEAATNCCGNISGCMDPLASNYDQTATVDDGSCEYLGCMNPLATNYDPTATIDDGSCILMWACDGGSAIVDSCASANGINLNTSGLSIENTLDQMTANPSTYFALPAPHYFPRIPTGGTVLADPTAPSDVCVDWALSSQLWKLEGWQWVRSATDYTNGVVSYTDTGMSWIDINNWINGVTTCHHSQSWYNAAYTFSFSQLRQFFEANQNICNQYSLWPIGQWCTCQNNPCNCNIDPTGTFTTQMLCEADTTQCCYINNTVCPACTALGADTTVPGCCTPGQVNYNPLATCNDLTCIPISYGCMDCGYIYEATQAAGWFCNGVSAAVTPGAFNYNSGVTVSSNTCIYLGCTDVLASNFNVDCDGYDFTGLSNPLGDPYAAAPTIDDGCCIAVSQMTYVPDLKFQAALTTQNWVSGWWDATGTVSGGDYCYTSEINFITTLNLNNTGITDMTGIEDFIALTWFECSVNNMTSLNMSNSTLLTELWCQTGNLTSLDVSGCTLLTKFRCDNNQLTSLDVSQNTILEFLWCQQNQLTSLDVSSNTALTLLNFSQNLLTSINVTNNTALTNLNCSSNQLTSLDVSSNLALTNLYCYDNLLTSLDVSNNLALTYLDCSDNQLTGLNIKNTNNFNLPGTALNTISNPLLTAINCDDVAWAALTYTVAGGSIDSTMTTWTAI